MYLGSLILTVSNEVEVGLISNRLFTAVILTCTGVEEQADSTTNVILTFRRAKDPRDQTSARLPRIRTSRIEHKVSIFKILLLFILVLSHQSVQMMDDQQDMY